jgi:hypothetical protein
MDESQESSVFDIKEAIHEMKLKDAITRQEIMRNDRETANLKEKIAKSQLDIQKLEKDLKKDEKLLTSQDENIVAAKIALKTRKRPKKNDLSLIQESIERQHQIIKSLKARHDELLVFLSNIRKKASYIDIALKDNKNSNDIMPKMREFINFYEENLLSLDSATKAEEILYQEQIKFYHEQYNLYEKELEELDAEHVSEIKTLYDLENRSNLSESDKVIYNKNNDTKTEQIAIASAEAILNRLKQKLDNSESLAGVVSKLDSQISKHKKKIIHVDLS